MTDINMQMFAKNAGTNMRYAAGSIIFKEGDPGDCMFVVQSGVIEMLINDRVVDVCGPNEAMGFLSAIDSAPRTATALVREAAEVSAIDQRKFRFMIDEVPNFALYIMEAMSHRIRGMKHAI
jgi:CRP/FNR family cyclic AMP-dependent transcriptional regulator